ncbi:NADH-quinone oxidoreductase subunit A [Buchnera aphidicola (Tetraneura ulmi)]|uniref:NADH-quinone oxidoreductase subunit A n=1 Tax=Buchnera aphidicola TaxID=9 RepID=UPI003464749B
MSTFYTSFFSHFSFLYFIFLSFLIVFAMLLFGWLLGEKSRDKKNIPFESGIDGISNIDFCYSVKFYLVAMIFVIFDVEVIYIYSWVTTINDTGWIGFVEMMFFVFELLVGLVYVVKLGILDWS